MKKNISLTLFFTNKILYINKIIIYIVLNGSEMWKVVLKYHYPGMTWYKILSNLSKWGDFKIFTKIAKSCIEI